LVLLPLIQKPTLGKGAARQLMSALGEKQTFPLQKGMSALPPKADICGATKGPKADIDGLRDTLVERFGLRQELS
jgi:hypothetical protein